MQKDKLHVAIIQSDLVWENPNQNRINFLKKINAIEVEVDLIILPEMFTTGFTMNINFAEKMNGPTIQWLQQTAVTKNTAITGSIIISQANKFYNRLLFVYPDGTIDYYDKHHLFALSGEDKVFASGSEKLIVNYKGWKICPFICYDLRFPTWSTNSQNYDLLLYVASWPEKRISAWNTLLNARAIENMSYTIGVNRIGADGNGLLYNGNSVAIDTLGNKISNSMSSIPNTEILILSKSQQDQIRLKLPFLQNL